MNVKEYELLDQSTAEVNLTEIYLWKDSMFALVVVLDTRDHLSFPLFFPSSVSGGRSRLHLIDLGSCEKVLCKSRDAGGGLCLSLTALGNVILALANGAKHVPYR